MERPDPNSSTTVAPRSVLPGYSWGTDTAADIEKTVDLHNGCTTCDARPGTIPGSELCIVDGAGGIIYFCTSCKSAVTPVKIIIGPDTVMVCEECFLEEICQDETQFESQTEVA